MKLRDALLSLFAAAALLLFTPGSATAQSAPQQDVSALTAAPGVNSVRAVDSKFSIGVGAGYNSHVEDPGIGAGAWVRLTEMISAGGQFGYWLVSEDGPGDYSLYTVDIMGSYPLMQTDSGLLLAALAGLNILNYSYSYEEFGFSVDESATDIGLNAGATAIYPMGNLNLFVQVFVVGLGGDSSGVQANVGVSFGL